MGYTDKEFCLEVWGDYACFTRPELKVERVSYDVITPSAARAIFDAIFFHRYAMRWEVTKIEVLNPVRWFSIRRNEVGAVGSVEKKQIYIEDARQQRNTLMLRDVRYRIHAKLIFIPWKDRPKEAKVKEEHSHQRGDDNPAKYYDIFTRKAQSGQCFTQPYFGVRECAAYFKLVDNDVQQPAPIDESKDLGIMFYDWDYKPDGKNADQMFFRANMIKGVITVPSKDSEEILR